MAVDRKKLGKKSANKGKVFEREIARAFRPIFPQAQRKLEDREGFGYDIENTGRLRIQCKRYKDYAPLTKIKEAYSLGKIPLLVTKADNKDVLVALPLEDFIEILRNPYHMHEENHGTRKEESSGEERREACGREEGICVCPACRKRRKEGAEVQPGPG